ncbi:zeta toxin family protein [Streptomyces alboflavus]|uniref:zeta toxin family protein n=1 Tax=Streptomyces alboflavus TaxID=67267 RepID=UPI000F65803B|nr:zeta toxin family protein [Streptomyces alboflavus]
MTDPEALRFKLPEKESRRIFERRIVPQLLAPVQPQDEPVTVVLMGQPGAGKTAVSALLGQRLNERGGYADVDSDLYKPFHPQYARFLREDDRLMTLYTGEDGRAWMRQAQQYVRDHRLNALVQEIAMNPPYLAQNITAYREAGSRIEVTALAVHQALSQQGILHRYHEQVKDRGHGRLTVPEKAAASYSGMLDSANLIEREGLADYVAVYRRGESEPRYANERAHGGWRAKPGFRQAIEDQRNRPLTPDETRDFLAVQDYLRAEMSPDFHPQLDIIERQATPLLHPETADLFRTMRRTSLEFPHDPGQATQQPRRDAEQSGPAPEQDRSPRPDLDL